MATDENKKKVISLDKTKKHLKINAFELDNEIVFDFFDKKVSSEEYDETFIKALYIGVLAMTEDRIASFFAKTQNELGTNLESLKTIFEMKKELFFKSAVKGLAAEDDIIDFLNAYFQKRKFNDKAEPTGTMAGNLPKNKTGDILCYVDGHEHGEIVIEVKFDKSYKLGDIERKDIFTKKADTAWGQVLEAKANRDSRVGIIVFDRSLVDAQILERCNAVSFLKGVGFIVIVDSQRGDFSSLAIAYDLARDLIFADRVYNAENDTLNMLVTRLLHDIEGIFDIQKECANIAKSNKNIMAIMEKYLLSFQFTKKYLDKFQKEGDLTKEDLLAFYNGEEVKDQFKTLDIDGMLEGDNSLNQLA